MTVDPKFPIPPDSEWLRSDPEILLFDRLLFKLRNSLSKHQGLRTDIEVVLFDRLLWLRNHYDVGKPELKQRVLADIDVVLDRVRNR
jgi:hypothetical protein